MTIVSRYIARGIAPAALLAVLLGACGTPIQSAATPQPTVVATTAATTVTTTMPAATVAPAPTVVPTSAPQPTAVPPTAEPEAASDLLYVD